MSTKSQPPSSSPTISKAEDDPKMEMALFHILIAMLITLYAVVGYRRGFAGQLASLLGMGFGIVAAAFMPDDLKWTLGSCIPASQDPVVREFSVGFVPPALVFLLVYAVFYLLTPILKRLMRVINIGLANALLGSVFGIFKTLMIVSVVLNIMLCSASPDALIRLGKADDANLTEETLILAPLLLGTPSVKDLALQLQLQDARKIS